MPTTTWDGLSIDTSALLVFGHFDSVSYAGKTRSRLAQYMAAAAKVGKAKLGADTETARSRLFGTSGTSMTIATGTLTLTCEPGRGWKAGHMLRITRAGLPSYWAVGYVTSYDVATGALVLDSQIIGSSATASDWEVAPA